MQHIFPPHPALECKQPQNQQRHCPDSIIAQRSKRQPTQHRIRNQRHRQATHIPAQTAREQRRPHGGCAGHRPALQTWCTGKDSNLRTSLGGTDLQSVGFNHSPTCAQNLRAIQPRSPASAGRRGVIHALTSCPPDSQAMFFGRKLRSKFSQSSVSQCRETKNLTYGLPRRDHCTREKVPNGVRWKNLLRHHLQSPILPETVSDSGAGEGI
jgi:hypothetical protein